MKIINSVPLLWVLLALPSLPMVVDLPEQQRYYPELMHETGILSVQLLALTIAVSPFNYLARYFDKLRPVAKWLMKRRRYFGVASFAYALLHLIFYVRETGDLTEVLLEGLDIELATGWIAFLIFLALAATSNDASLRKLGASWNRLHRLVYLAIILIFAHWYLLDIFLDLALMWAMVFVGLKLAQFVLRRMRGGHVNSSLAG